VRKEYELTLQQQMCGIEETDRFTCCEMKERLGIDDIIRLIQQSRLRWCALVSRMDEND